MFFILSLGFIGMVVMILLGIKLNWGEFSTVFLTLVVTLVMTFIGSIFASMHDCEVEINKTTYHEILPINGYYVDDKFRCVTVDNMRLDFDGEGYIQIKASEVVNPPYIKHYEYKEKPSIFGLADNINEYSIVLTNPVEVN